MKTFFKWAGIFLLLIVAIIVANLVYDVIQMFWLADALGSLA